MARPLWTDMRPEDFDREAPSTLVKAPAVPVTSTGDDLFALLGLPVVAAPARPVRAPRALPAGAPTLF